MSCHVQPINQFKVDSVPPSRPIRGIQLDTVYQFQYLRSIVIICHCIQSSINWYARQQAQSPDLPTDRVRENSQSNVSTNINVYKVFSFMAMNPWPHKNTDSLDPVCAGSRESSGNTTNTQQWARIPFMITLLRCWTVFGRSLQKT